MPKRVISAHTRQPIQTNPDQLPSWQPEEEPLPATTAIARVDAGYAAIDQLLSSHYGPGEETLALRQAEGLRLALGGMREQERNIFTYLGRIACFVEDYQLWRNLPGCGSFREFFESDDPENRWRWPLETVKTAMEFYRKAVPVARKAGIDLTAHTGRISSVKAKALVEATRPHRGKRMDEAAKAEVTGKIASILAMRDGDLLAQRREEQGKKERVPVYHHCQVRREGKHTVIQVTYTLDLEALDALVERRLYALYRVADETWEPEQLLEEVRRTEEAVRVGHERTLSLEEFEID